MIMEIAWGIVAGFLILFAIAVFVIAGSYAFGKMMERIRFKEDIWDDEEEWEQAEKDIYSNLGRKR